MSEDVEAAAEAAPGGFWRFRPHGHEEPEPGAVCANCATPLRGPWCHKCGQSGEDFHRSVWRLISEVFESLFHFDGRLWNTLPDLFLRPGRLTRAYLDGHRAPQVPPLRLFLVVLVLVFLTGSIGGGDTIIAVKTDQHGHLLSAKEENLGAITPAQKQSTRQALARSDLAINGNRKSWINQWLAPRIAHVLNDPQKMKLVMEQWSERFAFLMLPISAGLLCLLFVFQRRFYVFDHVIFSLHSLSAAGLLISASFLLGDLIGDGATLILLAAPVHLFNHMRGVYGSSWAGTLARMALLFVGSLAGFAVLMAGLLWVTLNAVGT